MTHRMVFEKNYSEEKFRGFKAVIEDVMELLAAFNIANYILQIASLDLQGLTKHMKVVAKVLDEFMEKIIDEHVQSNDDSRTKDFVDLMLSFMGSEDTDYRDKSRAYQSRNLELLSIRKINSFKSMRKEELHLLMEYLKEAACNSGIAVDLCEKVGALNAVMTCRMVFGKKYSEEEFGDRGFKAVIEEVMELLAAFNLADYILQIASLDL
ncbi:hypothetical protein ACOSQ4_022205 [Xanthoceras sorbifolium]